MTQKIHTVKNAVRHRRSRMWMLSMMSLSMLAALSVVSCNRENGTLGDVEGTDTAMMNMSVRLMSTDSATTGYEAGTDYENYIDIDGGDYRIYFFTNKASDGADTFIAQFTPTEFNATGTTSTYTTYSLEGSAPKALTFYDTFKVVILANWGTYPTLDSSSTIDAVCEPTSGGTYSCTAGFTPSATSLIPFYGVQEFENVTFIRDEYTDLTASPVNMLRAMAKIEVILQKETSDLDLAGVSLQHYNKTGYCAPAGIYSSADYVNSSTGKYDYSSLKPHLVGGENDTVTDADSLAFVSGSSSSNTEEALWYTYVSEFDNTTDEDTYAYIQLDLVGYGTNAPNAAYYRLYFDTDNPSSVGANIDILRNVIYRFNVTLKEDSTIDVHVDGWEKSFKNDFGFNTEDQDEGNEGDGND